jgi:hypothetical protein
MTDGERIERCFDTIVRAYQKDPERNLNYLLPVVDALTAAHDVLLAEVRASMGSAAIPASLKVAARLGLAQLERTQTALELYQAGLHAAVKGSRHVNDTEK